jgi:urease accessory protein
MTMNVQFINNLSAQPAFSPVEHHHGDHGHTHEHLLDPGRFAERDMPSYSSRDFAERGFTIGIGGFVPSLVHLIFVSHAVHS